MARAHDAFAFEFALIERAAVVRADVFDRVDRAVDVAEQHLGAVDDDAPRRARRDLRALCNACAVPCRVTL